MNRRWKIVMFLVVLLVLAAASAFLSLRVQPGNELDAYKKLLRSRGEQLELTEVLPPPAAPAENSADVFQDAAGMFTSAVDNYSLMRMVGPGRAEVGWRQPDVRGYDFTNTWEQYRAYVEADRPAVELLPQILERPKLDFQLNYEQGDKMRLSHLAPMKRAAMKLAAATLWDLHEGNTGAATTNVLTMLAIVQRDYRDDLIIGHLVRIAISATVVPATWEILQATNLTEAQLAAVQNGWQRLNLLKDAENTFTLERAWMSGIIEQCRASHENFQELSGTSATVSSGSAASGWESFTERPRYAVAEVLWRSSWSYSQEVQELQQNQVILETLRAMQSNRSQFYRADYDAMTARLSALGSTNQGSPLLRALAIPDFREEFAWNEGGVLRKMLQMEAARRVVVTAIALKRYQLAHGRFPKTLGDLAPGFLPSVPIDPFDGRPLKYRSNDEGTFVLYAVGEDGLDDGGDAGPATTAAGGWSWLRARDWVWPQPATDAEVEFYREHPLNR